MGPVPTDDPLFVETCRCWLADRGELFVERYKPHSGGSGFFYYVSSTDQLDALVRDTAPGSVLFVSRRPELPVRGAVGTGLIERAIGACPDGVDWVVVRSNVYPSELDVVAYGDSTSDLASELSKLHGQVVWVGPDLTFPSQYWSPDAAADCVIGSKPLVASDPSAAPLN
jgi:hypothetical protein